MVNRIFSKQNSVLSATAVLMAAVFLSGLLGLGRDWFLAAHFYSASAGELDVYLAAFRLPDMIFQILVVGSLAAAFIPVFTKYLLKEKQEAWKITSTMISLSLLLFIILASLIFFLATPLSRLIAPSFSRQQLELMVSITRWLLLAQGCFLISNFVTGMLQAQQHFLVPALAPLVYNISIILGVSLLSPWLGIYGPVVGVIGGAFLHLMIQLPLLRLTGYRFSWSFNLRHPGVWQIIRLMLPRAMALAITQLELTVAVFIATGLPAGSLAIFTFAQHLNNLAVNLFGATLGQAALPALAKTINQQSLTQFKQELIEIIHQTLYLALPAGMMLLVLRLPAVRLAFGAPSFPWEATLLIGRVVALLAISIFAQAVIQILVRGFYALGNTKTPFIIGTITVLINIVLSFNLAYRFNWGVLGLALALSITNYLQAVMLFFSLKRILGGFGREFWLPAVKMAGATLITGISLYLPFRLLDRYIFNTARTLELIGLSLITGLIGLTVYAVLSLWFKISQLEQFTGLIKRLSNFRLAWKQTEKLNEPIPYS